MATVYITTGQVGAKVNNETAILYLAGSTLGTEVITSSGVSAPGSRVALAQTIAKIVCATGVYATSGPGTPVAVAGNSIYCPPNVESFIAMNPGDKIAVLDA